MTRIAQICACGPAFIAPHAARRCHFLAKHFRDSMAKRYDYNFGTRVDIPVAQERIGAFGRYAIDWIFSFFQTSPWRPSSLLMRRSKWKI